jgi:hypothetical protein
LHTNARRFYFFGNSPTMFAAGKHTCTAMSNAIRPLQDRRDETRNVIQLSQSVSSYILRVVRLTTHSGKPSTEHRSRPSCIIVTPSRRNRARAGRDGNHSVRTFADRIHVFRIRVKLLHRPLSLSLSLSRTAGKFMA